STTASPPPATWSMIAARPPRQEPYPKTLERLSSAAPACPGSPPRSAGVGSAGGGELMVATVCAPSDGWRGGAGDVDRPASNESRDMLLYESGASAGSRSYLFSGDAATRRGAAQLTQERDRAYRRRVDVWRKTSGSIVLSVTCSTQAPDGRCSSKRWWLPCHSAG